MAAIKEIKAYKTSDGVIFEDIDDAMRYDIEKEFKAAIRVFANDKGLDYEETDFIYDTITENADELKKILAILDALI